MAVDVATAVVRKLFQYVSTWAAVSEWPGIWSERRMNGPALERYCPASERAQFDAVRQAVERGVTEVWQRLLFEIEWLNNDDVSLGWLECVAGFVEREKAESSACCPAARAPAPLEPATSPRGFYAE